MKKLVLITITTILKLINFISLTTECLSAPFKKMTRDDPSKNYKPEDSRPRTKPKRKNSIKILRHWKEDAHVSWEFTLKQTKLLLLTATLLHAIENLHKEETNMKLYNLIHNKSFLNQKGNAFPIKPDTMIKNYRRNCNIMKREHRKRRKRKERLLECLHHILNLRFLPQAIKKVTIDFTNVWKFITNHRGPKTLCPICTIPVIGVVNYLKQNFRNMTNAVNMAARNFNTRQLTIKILSKTLRLVKITAELLMVPLKRMMPGRFKRRNIHGEPSPKPIPKPKPKNMGQYDGNDDPGEWSSDNEEENNISATTEDPNPDCGWYKKPMEKYPKGIAYWYNPKQPKNKYSELKNAPKMNPPDFQRQERNTQEDDTHRMISYQMKRK